MSEPLRRGLVLALGLSLLVAGCSRRKGHEQTSSGTSGRPSQQAFYAVISSPTPKSEPERPSPFVPPAVEPPAPRTPAPIRSANSRKPARHADASAKPFVMPTTLAANTAGRTLSPALPPPPPIAQPKLDAGRISALLGAPCCDAAATYEPAPPNGFHRLIRKVPGLRRLDRSRADDPRFVPPRPLQDVRFALPADSNPALAREERMDLKATVDASGRVTRVELLAPRDENLVTLAADAASAWRFAPAQFDGRPVPSEIVLHFSFGAGSAPETAAATAKLP